MRRFLGVFIAALVFAADPKLAPEMQMVTDRIPAHT